MKIRLKLERYNTDACFGRILFSIAMLLCFTVLNAQNSKILFQKKQLTIKEAIVQIEKQTSYTVAFDESSLNPNDIIKPEKETTLVKLLDLMLKGTSNTYSIVGQHIIIKKQSDSNQEQKKISGKITDVNGEPLTGAGIMIKGTAIGTSSDINGSYFLNVPLSSVITVTYLGYKPAEIKIGERSVYDFILEEDSHVLNTTIVTALGIKREEKALGYSVQALNGSAVQTVKTIDVGTSLTGKVAGLLVRNSTEFTAEPDVQIRGEKPLLVVDGIPYANVSLRELPSDDIENISVLKGATASALYGYRGSSGAIMVTTKSGNNKRGVSVSANSSTMLSAGFLAIPETQSVFGRVVNTATNTYVRSGDGSWGVPMDGRNVILWDPISKSMQLMPYLPIGKDNFKNFLEQGFISNQNLNIVQQGEFGSFRASATWVRNKGQYPNSKFDKYSFNIGGDIKLERFTLSSNIAYNKQYSPNVGFSGYTGYDPMYNILVWAAADYDIRNYKDYWVVPNETQNSSYTATNNNPYFDRYERVHSLNKDIFNGTLAMNYQINDWLKATLRSGFDTYSNYQQVRISKGSFQGGGNSTVLLGGTEIWGESAKGSFNVGIGRGYSFNNDVLLSANKKINDFVLDGFAGASLFFRQDEGMEARTQAGLNLPGFYSLKSSVNPVAVQSLLTREQVNSIYGRVSVSWKNTAFAEGTLRNDWSSTLPQSTRSYLYPSLAGSLILSELLPKTEWLSLWKIRGSWTVSKTPASVYGINSVYSITNNVWGTLSSASYPTSIRGTDVKPESSSTFEIGTMVNLYKSRAIIDVTYYSKRMYDFLKSASISPASGFTSNYINTDEEITRRGIEISATFVPVEKKNIRWDMTLNWSKYARYYTKLDSIFSADKPWVKVGKRADHYILRDYLKDSGGNIIYNNGLPQYSAYDSLFGYADPDWIWGISSNLKYKNWQFSISLDGRVGGIAQTTTEMYMWRAGSHPDSVVPERMADALTPGSKNYVGKGVKIVSGTVSYDTYGNITSDTRVFATNDIPVTYKSFIEAYHKGTAWGGSPSPVDAYSTTFFKIRELAITYNMPKSICNLIRANSVSVSGVGQNLFMWAKQFKYSDPDGGSENFADPSVRYIGINIKLGF
jgi:TonB-linked SusC/RagA family outer membrane protein